MPRSVLIVEDEAIIRTSLREFLSDEGYQVADAGTVAAALTLARQRDFQVAICDVQLPDGDGLMLLRRLQQLNPSISGLIITAYATVENAVEAFKSGAFDYLVKPVIFDDLANKLNRLFQYRELSLENQALRRELARHFEGDEIVGSSRAIIAVQQALRRAAVTNSNVLLAGESGTGKELFARTLHKWGPKQNEQFVAVNCATQPTELLEGQLFGAKAGTVPGTKGELTAILSQATTGATEIHFDGTRWWITDLGSRNGTRVNGVPIKQRPLKPGDEITIGSHLTYRLDCADSAPNRAGLLTKRRLQIVFTIAAVLATIFLVWWLTQGR